jgi:diguanylate cyclase (GGDEF)-like protein
MQKRILPSLEHRSSFFWITAGIACVSLLGAVDYLTGYEISFSLFYLAPIALVAWHVDRNRGLGISMLSALSWLSAEIAAGQHYSQPAIFLWNTLIRLGFFVIVTYLVAELRSLHERERTLGRTDPVSGAINTRYFAELLEMEIARSRRYPAPFTLAYIDLDNFKAVNDLAGHDTGDEVIRFIVNELTCHLRRVDIVARLGGDEFALLLPTVDEAAARIVLPRLQAFLTEQMRARGWPVTFSIGAVACRAMPESPREIIRAADQLMYQVKNSTKNDIRFAVYDGTALKKTEAAETP